MACALAALREYAKDEPQMQFETQTFRKVIQSYKKPTLGIDLRSLKELLCLPDAALNLITLALNKSMSQLVWPHQPMISLNPLLGKPGGGIRTICKTPMIYRMALRTNTAVPNGEIQNKQPYDSATRGSSALTAALVRNVRAEIASWLKMESAAIFNDYHKFFDTLDIEVLVQEAFNNNFPLQELVLALMQHLAPRIIQVSGCSSGAISVFKSILAGCKFSKALTALYLQTHMSTLSELYKEANLGVFLDDSSMQNIARSKREVLSNLLPCMKAFGKAVRQLNLTLSPKAALSASSPELAKLLGSALSKIGLKFIISKITKTSSRGALQKRRRGLSSMVF